jgi:hypothetical protein
MKQSAAVFAIWGAAIVLWPRDAETSKRRATLHRVAAFGVAVLIPPIATVLLMRAFGVFDAFWFWTVDYAREYGTQVSWSGGWLGLRTGGGRIFRAASGLSILSLAGFLLALRNRREFGFWRAATLSLVAFISCCAGLHFREHYFIPCLPLLGIWAGVAIQEGCRAISSRATNKHWLAIPLTVALMALAEISYRHRAIFLHFNAREVVRYTYFDNPFPEAVEIGRYLRERCPPDQSIAVIGSEPELYFYSGRHSATGYIYVYPITERQKYSDRMAEQMIREIEERAPLFVILVNHPASWASSGDPRDPVHTWFFEYAKNNLEQIGFVDVLSLTVTEYHFDTWAGKYLSPKSPVSVLMFRRKIL